MAKSEKRSLTKEQHAALKPLFDKIESAYAELDQAVAGLSGADAAQDLGFCMSCPRPGQHELCSSFLGPGHSLLERCQREFCRHPLRSHF